MEKQIFFIENPLIDISVELKDNAILDKYELQHGQASLAGEKQLPIYDELWNMEGREAIPGGSGLNSARSCNFMLKSQGAEGKVTYFGCIGDDEKGKTLQKDLADSGMTGNFHIDPETPTGTCAVVVVDKERTLCANLAAACKYSSEHLASNMDTLKNAKIIYTTSFFITSNVEALMKVAQFATDNDVPLGYNLSAVFLLQFELQNVLNAIEHADYVFANEDEAAAYATSQQMEGADLISVAKHLAMRKKTKQNRPRVVILTQGAKEIIVAKHMPGDEAAEVTQYPVEALAKEQIVDTNGAGDAFVGGFMAQLYKDQDLATCVRAGISLSREVVQRSGCTFPENFKFE
uniref:Adenosine kinase n=1 Tax=Strombidium rassoulzadegani TaxID=1082188 RepID=A0A7S3FUY3_9SPIT|mmetsp:Transcript_3336/g.5553  ORF Transcript_3336/g.5553 Transcript_3336/m.5553 type:complete len:348 (+) Transcript_3336:20-1063(+)